MRCVRTIAVCGAILTVAACSKSNPLIGKWKLAPNASNECFQLGAIEFTDKTMTMATPLTPVTANVTYARDGDRTSVTLPNGQVFSFETESGGIKTTTPECHLVPDK